MSGNHPAEIAKYLLKGWCLLNDYCPNGHNIPLVRSRDMRYVCCCGDRTCKYYPGDELASPQPQASLSDTIKSSAPELSASPIATMLSAGMVQVAKSASPCFASGGCEFTFASPSVQINCVRLDKRSDHFKLLGDCYLAKVRIGFRSACPDVIPFQDVFKSVCGQLIDRVLIPDPRVCPEVNIVGSKVVINRSGAEYVFPESECILLSGLSPDAVPQWILQQYSQQYPKGGDVAWLEVSLSSSLGEVTCRCQGQ